VYTDDPDKNCDTRKIPKNHYSFFKPKNLVFSEHFSSFLGSHYSHSVLRHICAQPQKPTKSQCDGICFDVSRCH